MAPPRCDERIEKLVVRLHDTDEKWSFEKIAAHVGMSKYGVWAVYQRVKHPKLLKTGGKRRSTDERTDRKIARKSREDPHLTAPEIREELGLEDISVRTVQRRLEEAGLFGRWPAEKPLISPKNVKERMKFAKEHKDWTVDDWKRVLWSDESKFNFVGNDAKGYVRRPVNERFNPKYTKGTVKFGGGNIMVWGCFSWYGLGPLRLIDGKMDRFQYQQILSETMFPHFERLQDANQEHTPIFQQDNDLKHKAKIVTKLFEDNVINVLPWPAQSPYLNPIENLWCEAERRLGGRKFKKPEELFAAVKKSWESILIESMPRRCKAVIEAGGYATKC